jgi:putative SOS response-associated peptidase YedK
MCARFTLNSPRKIVEHTFGVDLDDIKTADAPRYNIAPSQDVLTIAIGKEGHRKAIPMRWGLIPPWSRDGKTKGSTINARIERAAVSPLYRESLRRWRCLIPADGFYEWSARGGESRGRGKQPKKPYWLAREDGQPFAFAGLYSVWRATPEDPWLLSCAIVTQPALGGVERIHERMPVILAPYRWQAWIDREMQDRAAARALLERDPTKLVVRPVSTLVNSPDNDGPELLREVAP